MSVIVFEFHSLYLKANTTISSLEIHKFILKGPWLLMY